MLVTFSGFWVAGLVSRIPALYPVIVSPGISRSIPDGRWTLSRELAMGYDSSHTAASLSPEVLRLCRPMTVGTRLLRRVSSVLAAALAR